MTYQFDISSMSAEEIEKIQHIRITPQEETYLVRLATLRSSRELYAFDSDIKARPLKGLVEKGLAIAIEGGWQLTTKGQIRCTSIY